MPLESQSIKGLSDFNLSSNSPYFELPGSYYQPNFILVNQQGYRKLNALSLFGDIVPVYKSYQELTNVIVTSWEGLHQLVLLSKTFATCLLSFLNTILHSAVYQGYLIISEVYHEITTFPTYYNNVSKKIGELISTLSDAQTRDLWWLGAKIDIRSYTKKISSLLNSFWLVLQKFYLAVLVFTCVGMLNFASFASAINTQSESFLSKFIQNNSITSIAVENTESSGIFKTIDTAAQDETQEYQVQTITQYQVGESETVDSIAQMHGILPETITFNNTLQNQQVSPDQEIFIPWVDGYIYSVTNDILAQDLANIYGFDVQQIIDENIAAFNVESGKFLKGSLVLIPTTDFAKIESANKLEEARVQALNKQAQKVKDRQAILSANSVKSTRGKFINISSTEARANGFIWPTMRSSSYFSSGYRTKDRPSHNGIDLASNPVGTSLPIFAVQKGVVVKSSFTAGGYGNYIVIDHGNGVRTLYAHLQERYMSEGQTVAQGQTIGAMGRTGRATGVHLHFEVTVNGVNLNPFPFLP